MPRICFVNKLDRVGADFWRSSDDRRSPGRAAVPVQLPIGTEDKFKGVIDLVRMKAIMFRDDLGNQMEVVEIPEELLADARKHRERIVEAVAEMEDGLMHKYLEGDLSTEEEIIRGLRLGTLQYRIVPIFTGSALKNKGIQLDARRGG